MSVLDIAAEGTATSASGGLVRGPDTELSETACMILISASTVGRVAFVGIAGPELVPVNFALVDGVIYFLAEPRGFLGRLKRGKHAVAFGVDYHADTGRDGWDVTVTGTALRAGERATRRVLLKLRPYAGGDRPAVMQIHLDSVVGHRVSVAGHVLVA